MSYDAKGELTSSTDGRGNTTTYAYDANGNRTSMTDPLGKTTTYTYDGAGRLVSTTDALGHVSTSTYDGAGNVLTRTDPLGKVTQYAYDAAANLTTTTDANGHVTTSTYDAAGRLASTTAPDGGVTSYTYDNAGNQLTVTDALGHVTTSTYDNDNRLASTTSPLGEKTTYTYDADGNLTSAVDPRGNVNGGNPANYTTSHSYDAAGRELTTTDQLGHSTSRTYDSAGRLTSTTDADGHTTAYSYDALGRLLSTTAPDGGITSYSYDGNGNVVSRTDPKNHATTYVYDADNRLTNVTSPLSKTWTTTYNAAGQAITKTSPRGITTTYGLDADGHVTTVNYSDSTPAASYTYDAAGNRLSMNDRAGTVTFAYDSCDRLLRATRGSDTFSYTYDRSGNLLTRTYPDGKVTTYSYDQDGRMASATSSGATTAYTYDPAGDLTQTNLPSSNGYVETRSYDRAARLIDVTNAKAGTALSRFALTVDNVGNPTQVVRSGGISMTSNFAYDANDRLTSVSGTNSPNIAWTYDKAGNRLTETRGGNTTNYTYNADDQLTAAGSTSYSYDADGDNIQAGSRTFSYDGADELTSTSAAGSTTSYTYDGDGNRLSASGGANPATYLWDTNGSLPQLAIERGSNGSELRAYTYGVRRLALTTPSGAFYYDYDNVGSIVNVTSAAGATEWTDAYEPFGTIFTETKNDPNAPANPMHFAAEYKDSTALYNLRARSYDPATGRFLGVDPLSGSADSYPGSLYAYANQNPVRFTDPSGRGPLSATNDFGEMAYAASSGGDAVTVIPWEPQGYALYYPYDRKLVLGRVDAGIDSKIAHQGPIFAIADSHVSKYDPPGTSSWQGLGAIYFTLDKGIPWGGTTYKKWYSAEGGWFTPSLRYVPGPKTPRPMAYAGQVVAYTKSGWQESGFDAGQDKNGDKKSPEGYDFLHFCHLMRRLGHFAPGA
jgi:RHS repeat-associated protein